MPSKRLALARLAQQTLEICAEGRYVALSGATIDISAGIAACLAATVHHTPATLSAIPPPAPSSTRTVRVSVTPETTLEACARLIGNRGEEGLLTMNFASAKYPGGGFETGAQAQEQSLARASAMYPSLMAAPGFYTAGRASENCLYVDHLILSPAVPVFRDDAGALLDRPYRVTIVTAAAPNAGIIMERDRPQLLPTLARRAELVLRLAHHTGARRLVLGAWGCGVFRNDPQQVAEVFRDLLKGPYSSAFDEACFAIHSDTDPSTRQCFEDVLLSGS